MTQLSIPCCIQFFQIVGQLSDRTSDLFSPQHASFKDLSHFIKNTELPLDIPSYSDALVYFQSLLLLGLTFHKGIFISDVNTIQLDDSDSISILWRNGIKDQFEVGKSSDAFDTFLHSYSAKVFGAPLKSSFSLKNIIQNLHAIIQSYLSQCHQIQFKLHQIITKKNQLSSLLSDEMERNILFIILSGLPSDQLNALFIHIQQFFPEDLNIKAQDGHKINVAPLFESPSTDITYLIYKVRVYLDLYYSGVMPIIQHITRSKTRDYLLEILSNTMIHKNTIENLTQIKESQVDLRVNLYKLYENHLTALFKS